MYFSIISTRDSLIKVAGHFSDLTEIFLNLPPSCWSVLHTECKIQVHAVRARACIPLSWSLARIYDIRRLIAAEGKVNIYDVYPFDLTLHRCGVVCWDFSEHCRTHSESVIGCLREKVRRTRSLSLKWNKYQHSPLFSNLHFKKSIS